MKTKFKLRTAPLKLKEVLEKILNSRSRDSPIEKEVLGLVPDPDFLIGYLSDVVEFRRIYLSPRQIREEDEERLRDSIEKKLERDLKVGTLLGFSRETLADFARIITENTEDLEGVKEWKKKLANLKK